MHVFKPLVLLCPVALVATYGFGQNVIDGQSTKTRVTLSGSQTLAAYLTASITKPSPGQFNYATKIKAWQTNGTGWGRSAEYRMKIRGGNYGGILFSDTPTNATLYVPGQKPFTWPIRRYEFDVLWTYQFAPVLHRAAPYVTSGAGGIALNGGTKESGWDKQAALVAGAGSDVRLSRFITLRVGLTMDFLKASTYSDRQYRSTGTVMVEPRIGFVWDLKTTAKDGRHCAVIEQLARGGRRLSEFCCVLAGDLVDLLVREMLGRHAGRIAGFAEEAVQAGGRHNPEKEQFVIGIGKPVPRVPGDENGRALLNGVMHIVEYEVAAAVEDVEGFIHMEVAVDRHSGAGHHLLSAHGEIVRAVGGADVEEDVAVVAKVDQVLALRGAEHEAALFGGLSLKGRLGQRVADAEASQSEEEGSAYPLICGHEILRWRLVS